MSVPVFVTALLLAGAPADAAAAPSQTVPADPVATGPNNPAPAVPAIPSDPASSPPAASASPPASAPASPPPAKGSVPDAGEIVVQGRGSVPGDPMQQLNAQSFEAVQAVDKAVVEPAAKAYKKGLPKPVRSGLRNFLNNLREPVVFLNYMLQLKPGKAAETLGRFTINTTIGGVGLFDVAKKRPFNLPRRANGFANTLGYYGVKPGPYFYLPLVGPTTLRDVIGVSLDQFVVPFAFGKPFNRPAYVIPTSVVGQLDDRVQFDDQLRELHESEDPYVATREFYLKRRQAEIDALHGKVAPPPVVVPTTTAPSEPPAAPAPDVPAQPDTGQSQAPEGPSAP